jgi:beta-mannosidase
VKRESSPLCLGINRTTPELKVLTSPPEQILGPPHDLKAKSYIFDIWAVNMTLIAAKVRVEVRLYDIQSGAVLEEKFMGLSTLQPNQTTELAADWSVQQTTSIQAKLLDTEGNLLARMSDWPQPLKHVLLPLSYDVALTVLDGKVEIRTNAPVKGVELYMEDEARDVQWSDNGVDVFPGDVYVVEARNLVKGDDVRVRYYGCGGA